MAENNTYIKQEFENGEILNAEHLNHIEDAIEEIYNILDVGYKSAKFKDVEEFKKYASNRKKVIILDKYKSKRNKDEIQYTCIDTDGNYYIINQTSKSFSDSFFIESFSYFQASF